MHMFIVTEQRHTVAREPLQLGHTPTGPLLPNSLLPRLSKSLMDGAPTVLPDVDGSAPDEFGDSLGAAM